MFEKLKKLVEAKKDAMTRKSQKQLQIDKEFANTIRELPELAVKFECLGPFKT